ncbi:MAG: NTP transferase domain-containing protein [Burkholderiaceae bacterium]
MGESVAPVAAVLLAAGEGSRMGSRPKSLLQIDGQPLITRLLRACLDAGIEELVVVLGHYADQISPAIGDLPARLVINPNPEAGLVSSQRLGLAALSGSADANLMALADQPLLVASDLTDLLAFWRVNRAGVDAVYPQVEGQRGNPVVISAAARDEILADGEQVGCRDWQRKHPNRTMPFVTSNEHFRVDLDTEADVARLRATTGWSVCWPSDG